MERMNIAPISITTCQGDEILFDGKDTFNFAGCETQEIARVIALRNGLTQLLDIISTETIRRRV